MIFSYDKFNRLERPLLYLANPYKKYFGAIHNVELHTNLCFNSMSELTFKSYQYQNGIQTPYYDEIEVLKLIETSYIGWFQITECVEHGEGNTKYKEVTARTLENELTKKMLTSFGAMGVKTDSQGGLDRYCLYNPLDTAHSILHIVMEKAPLWTVGHIDTEITTEYRTFNEDSIDAYSFLMGNVSKAFECIFVFDTFTRTINAYKLENIGKQTSIFLSHRNVIEHAQMEENADDIYTVMTVSGGDYDGSPLQITDVNPAGTSYICNFDYYYPWFSPELKQKISEYANACEERKSGYSNALLKLKKLLAEAEKINNRLPATSHSVNWNEYGAIELQGEFDYYNQKMSLYLDGRNEMKRQEYYNILYGSHGIANALKQRKQEYQAKQAEILHQQEICNNFILNMESFLGNDLYKELSSYFYFTSFVDDTFVATRTMTDSEILEMKTALFEQAKKKLAEVSHPSYTMTIDSENFTALPKYKSYTEQLSLGCMVTVELEEDRLIYPRLLKMSIDWDNLSNFTLTFSSKENLSDGYINLAEIQQLAQSAATSQALSGIGWDAAKKQTSVVSEFMSNAFNAAKNKLLAGKNEEFKIDGTGTLWRKWVDERNDYSPNQMWGTSNGLFLTNSAWETVDTAIGELYLGTDANGNDIIMYGIAAPLLLGKITISEQLYIFNDSGNYSITNDGLVATNGKNTLKITPNDNNCLFSILKDGRKKLWFNNNGDAWFEGHVTASEITSSKFTCTNGVNTILIDPGNPKLFQILKGSAPVLYFTENGDAVFKGKMTVGTIFSDNWLQSGGNEDGTLQGTEGTFIDLAKGTFHFGGKHLELTERFLKCNGSNDFTWMGVTHPNTKRYVKISESYIQTQYDNGQINLFITPRGIATGKTAEPNPNAENANSGIIDFYSSYLGESTEGNTYQGITVRARSAPVCLSSAHSSIVMNPNDETSDGNMYTFTVNSNQNGHLKYGRFRNKDYSVGMVFNQSEGKIKISNGDTGLGDLQCNQLQIKSCKLDGKDLATYLEHLKQDWQTDLDEWAKKYNDLSNDYMNYRATYRYSSCSSCCPDYN